MSSQDDHVIGLSDLAPQMWEEVVLQTVRDTHEAVADRAFGLVPGSDVPKAVHDGVADLVYGALTMATRGTRRLAGTLARATGQARDPDALERSVAWRTALAILNGVLGDLLESQGNPLALGMTVRVDARDVAVETDALREAFPDARPRVAVLLHGLVENDESWSFKAASRGITYPEVLTDLGVTPVLLRYNTGRHVSANAADLTALLERLVAVWPVGVDELILIGHSMGALVIRGAGECARIEGHRWPDRTRHVVMLGAPHLGAPLEKVANAGAWLLSAIPESAAFGAILRRRSAGIKDLRHGYLTEEDWSEKDADAWRSDPARAVDRLAEAGHHVVGATLGATQGHPLSRTIGDLLVMWGSASAHAQEWARVASVRHVGSADHFALLNHPDVADLLTAIVVDGAAAESVGDVAEEAADRG
ncbi:lipase family alpha/beta hydrolase [Euzebya sp.]|uniref:lipase family alpha/beta hydrolase n=1 Tax=Euzebya sp. TaxID=1971409 RepID=UPI0035127206